jgi:hypothetical protein
MLHFFHSFGLALIVLGGLAAERPARADTVPRHTKHCSDAQMDDPSLVFKRTRRDQIVRVYEVIVEGTIVSFTPPDTRDPGLIIMNIDKIWKGEVAPRVTWLIYPTGSLDVELPPQLEPADCPPQISVGQRIRIGSNIRGKSDVLVSRFPDLDPNIDFLGSDSFWSFVYLPQSDPELDGLLVAYQAKTKALQQAAATGDVQARIDFAAHLLAHNQQRRAQEVADALRRDGVKLAAFGAIELTGERKNWSDLKRVRQGCYGYHANLDGAVFDRADFAECAFRYSSFRNASFRGTDLTGSYFQDSDLTGAQYDCATKLPDGLDPIAAGMINVQGDCPAP